MNIIGEVDDKTAIILDDMVDTAGTLVEATRTLLEKGAKAVYACVTHAILSGPAIERIDNSTLESLIVTDTLPLRDGHRQLQEDQMRPFRQAFCPGNQKYP